MTAPYFLAARYQAGTGPEPRSYGAGPEIAVVAPRPLAAPVPDEAETAAAGRTEIGQ